MGALAGPWGRRRAAIPDTRGRGSTATRPTARRVVSGQPEPDPEREALMALYELQRATAEFLNARTRWIGRWVIRLAALCGVTALVGGASLFLLFGEAGRAWGWLVPWAQMCGALLVVVILPINLAPPAFRERGWFDYGLVASQVAVVVSMLSFAVANTLELAHGKSDLTVGLTLGAMVLIAASLLGVALAWTRRPF